MCSISSVISVRVRSLTSGARLSIVPPRLQRRWVRLVRSPFSRYFFRFSRRSSLCCSCASCVSARSFRLGAGRGFSVLPLGLTSFDFGDKKTVNFSHSATSQRSVFRYSVFQTCWRRTAFYAVCGRQVHKIAALAAQGVATLTERSDATFSVKQFSSADGE